jgi:hypothetical protein
MAVSNEWCIAVFKCSPDVISKVLVEVYRFVDDLKGVRSLHFLSKDRVDDEVVFSFRIKVDPKLKGVIKSKLAYKLGTLLSENKFSIDPALENSLEQYVGWSPEKRIAEMGPTKFNQLVDSLKNMSANIIEMIEHGYFGSSERVELAYVFSQMLGCTEYGALYVSEFEVGYYDRLDDKYCPKLREKVEKPARQIVKPHKH